MHNEQRKIVYGTLFPGSLRLYVLTNDFKHAKIRLSYTLKNIFLDCDFLQPLCV